MFTKKGEIVAVDYRTTTGARQLKWQAPITLLAVNILAPGKGIPFKFDDLVDGACIVYQI